MSRIAAVLLLFASLTAHTTAMMPVMLGVGLAIPGMPALQLALGIVAFAVLAGLFAIRAMGGGDVKLLTALSLGSLGNW